MGSEEAHFKRESSMKQPANCLRNLSFYFTEYCDNTSIHGLKFLGERGRTKMEKIWWLLFIGTSLYFCITLILQTYSRWMNAPVMVSFATSETPIWKIPFPAVTVCPLLKTVRNKFDFDILMESNGNFSKEEAIKLTYASLVCPKAIDSFPEINLTDVVDHHAIQFLLDAAPDFNDTLHDCIWARKSCSNILDDLFMPVLTSGGVCYSFNMLDRDQIFSNEADVQYYQNVTHQPPSLWDSEVGYPKESELITYPRRTMMSGTNGGFQLTLYAAGHSFGNHCGSTVEGFKVILHQPAELPRYQQRYFWVPLDQLVTVAVKPNMMTTSKELEEYHPEDRRCYFKTEKNLRYFKIYRQQNCLMECLSNYTYHMCECVGFYMPRDSSMAICGPAKLGCLEQANIDFVASEAEFQLRRLRMRKSMRQKARQTVRTDCGCLPSCYALHFDAETSQLNWNWHDGKFLRSYDNQTAHLSKVKIFFKDLQFITSQRNELYGQTEFWANCGGLIGLFTGFSFISVIEILYFATLRFVCNIRKYGWLYWSGAEELMEIKVEN